MADAAGVGRRADIHLRPRTVRTVSGKQIDVLVIREMRQLVESDKVIRLALVFHAVLRMLHASGDDLRARREFPCVLRRVVFRTRHDARIVILRFLHQLAQLRKRLSQDQRLVVRHMHLTQRLDHKRVGLPASRRSAVERLVLSAAHKRCLTRLRLPDDITHLPLPAAALRRRRSYAIQGPRPGPASRSRGPE